uniref:Serpin domain-containing protein n=1 Tax=Pseudonaja textilis TaxID=8673 RepID=A0A670Z3P0_PSETE
KSIPSAFIKIYYAPSVPNNVEVHQRFQELISHINKPCANYSLGLVNQLFGETSYDFLTSFIESTEKFYHAGLEKLNFKQASEDSRRHINAWVEEKTSGENDNKSLVFAFRSKSYIPSSAPEKRNLINKLK